jgi:hypothetical protein
MLEANSPKTAQAGQKRPALIAGLGAAAVASVVTVIMLSGTPSPTTTATTDQPAKACNSVPLIVTAFSGKGGGTVRFREGDWLSPPITLTNEPQPVVFPRARSQTEVITEVITIEGQATDLTLVWPMSQLRMENLTINGVVSYTQTWLPMPCQ